MHKQFLKKTTKQMIDCNDKFIVANNWLTSLPDAHLVVSVAREQRGAVSRPGERHTSWVFGACVKVKRGFGEVGDHRFALQVPDFDAFVGTSAQPVFVWRKRQTVDDWAGVQRVQWFAFVQVPQHSGTVLHNNDDDIYVIKLCCSKSDVWWLHLLYHRMHTTSRLATLWQCWCNHGVYNTLENKIDLLFLKKINSKKNIKHGKHKNLPNQIGFQRACGQVPNFNQFVPTSRHNNRTINREKKQKKSK